MLKPAFPRFKTDLLLTDMKEVSLSRKILASGITISVWLVEDLLEAVEGYRPAGRTR